MSDWSITGLAGVILWTSAERHPAMRRFYVEVLGLTPRSDRAGFVNFAWGDTRLTISTHQDVEGRARDPLRVMVNLAVEGLDDAHRRLTGLGVECLRPPQLEHWAGRIATYLDPDGNVVQLMELPRG
jgi:predicted enzyme related to lactoylglutathione lyase